MLKSPAAGTNDTTPSARKPQPASTQAPELEKDRVSGLLEHPFRSDQIKLKDGVQYVDGASVIQRLNDVLGTPNWSFRILGDPIELEKEVIVRGRLTAWIDYPQGGQGRLRGPRVRAQAVRQQDRLPRRHAEVNRVRCFNQIRHASSSGGNRKCRRWENSHQIGSLNRRRAWPRLRLALVGSCTQKTPVIGR